MSLETLIDILHITDPTLPIGGFSHSNGLETYVQQKQVTDADETRAFVESMLVNNYKYNDALAVKLAHQLTTRDCRDELIMLDHECHALKAPYEVRQGSMMLGNRLLTIYVELLDDPRIEWLNGVIEDKTMAGHYAVVFGVLTAVLTIETEQAVCAFLYNAAVALVTNAVKLVPLGQTDGQKILHQMQGLIQELTKDMMTVDRNMFGLCNAALDIKCMQHEQLYSRLYMS